MSIVARAFAIALIASSVFTRGASAAPIRLLVLHAYGDDTSFRAQFQAGFDRVIDPMLTDGSLELYTETLDADRFPGAAHLEAMKNYLQSKYTERPPDVIVAVLDSTLGFVLSHRTEIFSGIPVVALVMRRPSDNLPPDVIAWWLGSPYREVAEIAERLDPGLRYLAVVSDNLTDQASFGEEVEEELAELNGHVSIIQLHDLRLNELVDRVRVLPPETAIIFIRQLIGDGGAAIRPQQALAAVTRVSKVPVYATVSALLGHGVVGGAMMDLDADGAALARSALELAGATDSERPHPFQGVITPIFDWRQLQRWGISEDRLPARSVVRFKDTAPRAPYRAYLFAAALIIASQSALIVAIAVQRLRRRAAEASRDAAEQQARRVIEQSEARSTAILQAVPDLMFVISRDGTYLDFHARDHDQLFVPPEVFLGKAVRDVMPPSLADRFMVAITDAAKTDASVVVEYDLPIGGEERHFEARLVRDRQHRIVAVVRDLTERVRTERALADSEAALRQTSAENRDLAGRLIAGQEAERQRIARDLHDDLGQRLSLLNVALDQFRITSPELNAVDRERLDLIADTASEITSDIHRLSHDLHPARLEALGLVKGIAGLCRDLGRQHGLTVQFEHGDVPGNVNPAVSICLYRITQEALHNVVRHSGARHGHVKLSRDGEHLYLQIADSGVGFDDLHRLGTSGLGLLSMRERAHHVGGRLIIHTAPGAGTRIGVLVPLTPDVEDAGAGIEN
ncbi:MAG TPA: PAS domain-containing protein [Vicinamibacterales bacterium]|nr:PAS domain-containing protein [Vicinamibacterales bacterium]